MSATLPPETGWTPPPPTPDPRRLWIFGGLMLIPTVAFTLRYPLPGNTNRLVDIGKMASYGLPEFVGYLLGIATLYLLYGVALRETRRMPAAWALSIVFRVGIVMAGIWAWLYPVNAIDLFIYSARSRLFTTYGVNPLAARPLDYWHDPLMHVASREWADNVSPYGPLWNLLAAPFTLIGGENLALTLAGYKVLAIGSLLLGGWLISRYLAVIAPERQATGVLLYLWNPLVLWEGVGNGHNDVVMVVPLLLGFVAWAHRRDRWVIPALVVATLIKYVTLLLVPLAFVALWRRAETWPRHGSLVIWSGCLSVVAVLVALFPFYDLASMRSALGEQGRIFLVSPAAMAIGLWHDAAPVEEIRRWVTMAGLSIMVVALIWSVIAGWRRPRRLPRLSFELMFTFLLVATWNFRPWYLIWPLALAALLPFGWPAWRMIAWTAGGLAGYALFIWVWAWWGADFYTVQNVAVPLITGPCLVLTLIEISRWVIHRARTTRARRSSFTAPVFGAAPMSQFKDGPRG